MVAHSLLRSVTLSVLMSLSSQSAQAQQECRIVLGAELAEAKIGDRLELKMGKGGKTTIELTEGISKLLEADLELAGLLQDPIFVQYAHKVANAKENSTVGDVREILFDLWNRATGSVKVNEKLKPDLLKAFKQAAETIEGGSQSSKLGYIARRNKIQLLNLPKTLSKIKNTIQTELNPRELDKRVFAFYGYLNLGLDASRLREWPAGPSITKMSLNDVTGIDPATFAKVAMMASEIEAPIAAYSDNSGETLRAISPQASRFMGKTTEESLAHQQKMKDGKSKIYCTNSWCVEENRHEGVLARAAQNVTGWVQPAGKDFTSYAGLDPLKPETAFFHLYSRNSTEWNAGSAYFFLGGHATGALEHWMSNIRNDEVKHMSLFGGLYVYLKGHTYGERLKEMLKKALHEIKEKNGGSQYGDVFNTEPISVIEFIYTHVVYEQNIRKFFQSLPLKSLRKIYETDVKISALDAVPMDPKKEAALAELTAREKVNRTTLARWPKVQRDAYLALEAFEVKHNAAVTRLIRVGFNSFHGAESFENQMHLDYINKIDGLSSEAMKRNYGMDLDARGMALLKRSLKETIRDYQIMNNAEVRAMGLNVALVDVVKGFDVVKDAAYHRAEVKKVKEGN